MPAVFYVHGFSAAELYLDSLRSKLYWVDLSQILLRTPGAMRLNAAGDGPGGPDGRPLFVGDPLTPYVGLILQVLDVQLHQASYRVLTHSYDWRMDLYAAGVELADRVRLTATEDDPCTLVGHSAGGLVCRAAWRELVIAGESERVRRIVTIGTPHWGTYYAVATWSGLTDLITQLTAVGQIVGGGFGSSAVQALGTFTVQQLVNVCLTWPALYQLLPLVGAPDQSADPHRPDLYDSTEWHGIAGQISALHLGQVLTVRDAWLNDPRSRPPSWVMSVVSGTGFDTPGTLADPDQLGLPSAIGFNGDGDGVVTADSAEGGFPFHVRLTAAHSDLPRIAATSGLLPALILNTRGPLDPIPPSIVDGTPEPVTLGGPPLPVTSLDPSVGPRCSGPLCHC